MPDTKKHSERAHALLSASSAYRWLECPPSAAAVTRYPDEGSTYAAEGTRAHEVAEAVLCEHRAPSLINIEAVRNDPSVTQEMLDCAERYKEYILEHFDDSPDKVFFTETQVDFSAWVPDGFGTCDALLVQGRKLDIFDYKYGQGVPVYADHNPQMMLYALGALNDYGFMLDVETVEMHIFQPRLNNVSSWETTAAELVEWAEKTVKPIAKLAAAGKGKFKPGPHCRFCPHAGRCRALTKSCTDFVELHGAKLKLPVLAPHEIAEVLNMEPVISNWLRRVKAQALTDMLDGKTVPGWKAVEGRQGNRKWPDEAKVIELLRSEGYTSEDYLESKLKTPSGIDSLLGKKRAAELLADVIVREAGTPSIAPESDKRPAINAKEIIIKDFED